MAPKKHNTNNTPRRKRNNRNARLQNAKKWAVQYEGKNLAKGYSNWFGVDLLCSITELEIIGYIFKRSYKEQVKQSLEARKKQKEKRKRDLSELEDFEEEMFYFVAGYTANGVPSGLTREEMGTDDETDNLLKSKESEYPININDEDLPF